MLDLGIGYFPRRALAAGTTLLLTFGVFWSQAIGALSVDLEWDQNPEPDVAGYRVYYHTTSGGGGEQVVFSGNFAGSTSQFNFNGDAAIAGTRARITSGVSQQTGTVWTVNQVNISQFTCQFTFQLIGGNGFADGFTFAIQRAGNTVVGGGGGWMGYEGIGNSVAVKFDTWPSSSTTGLYTNGAAIGDSAPPSVNMAPSGIALQSGHVFSVLFTYDGATLHQEVTDTTTNAVFTRDYAIDIPATIGGSQAYIGFTGATGGQNSTQDILDWSFSNAASVPETGVIDVGNTTSVTIINLAPETTYIFTATAYNTIGLESFPSDELQVTTSSPFEAWQEEHFTASELADPALEADVWGALSDPDGDNISNLLEYAFGLDPRIPDLDGPASSVIAQDAGQSYAAITFQRSLAVEHLRYTVQVSDDFATWRDGSVYEGDAISAVTAETTEVSRSDDGFIESITVRTNSPIANPSLQSCFLRVQVTDD